MTIEEDLIHQVIGLDLEVLTSEVQPTTADDAAVHVELHIDEDDVETSAFGLIYALSALSFRDARPRGYSGHDYNEHDDWSAVDMLEHLSFRYGHLYFYADYVRGRCMKTDIHVSQDGKIVLETINRGQAATRWVQLLQGKKLFEVVK